MMKRLFAVTAAAALLCLSSIAQATITVDTVAVGDAGNAADNRYETPVCGSVGYSYSIAKYEVTAAQYAAFLNAVAKTDTYGLYNSLMWGDTYGCRIQQSGDSGDYSYAVASDWANRPVNYVSYWDACRFSNWLHNGQPIGEQNDSTTERGAYTLDGYNGTDGRTIQRNANWKWAVTTEDEWYKAAYYKGGEDAGYWNYPTQNDDTPSNVLGDPTDPGNNATYWDYAFTIGGPYYRTEVGAHENSDSAYGTFDQGGNVWEWNEAIVYEDVDYVCRGLRGGSFGVYGIDAQSCINDADPSVEGHDFGFRVVTAVPEPSSITALACALLSLLGIRRRRA